MTSLRDQLGMYSREGWVEKCRGGPLKVMLHEVIRKDDF